MAPTEEQLQAWNEWLSERPANVRAVAERIVPWKEYRDKRDANDIGNRYSPRSYEEQADGSVTITCEKINDTIPFFGGYGVFGMSADNLEEADEEPDIAPEPGPQSPTGGIASYLQEYAKANPLRQLPVVTADGVPTMVDFEALMKHLDIPQ